MKDLWWKVKPPWNSLSIPLVFFKHCKEESFLKSFCSGRHTHFWDIPTCSWERVTGTCYMNRMPHSNFTSPHVKHHKITWNSHHLHNITWPSFSSSFSEPPSAGGFWGSQNLPSQADVVIIGGGSIGTLGSLNFAGRKSERVFVLFWWLWTPLLSTLRSTLYHLRKEAWEAVEMRLRDNAH